MIKTRGLNAFSLNGLPRLLGKSLRAQVPYPVRRDAANMYGAQLLRSAKIVVLDYNGVIINDEHIQEKVDHKLLGRYGFGVTHEDYVRIFLGRSSKDCFPDFFRERGVEPPKPIGEFIMERIPIYHELVAEEDPVKLFFGGAKELILLLSEHYKKNLAIASMSRLPLIKPGLEKLGLSAMFQNYLISGEQIEKGRGKPCPDVYQRALSLYELPPRCVKVAIEDTAPGVKSAKAAGMFCIAVLHTSPYDKLRAAGADVIVEDLNGLLQILKRSVR